MIWRSWHPGIPLGKSRRDPRHARDGCGFHPLRRQPFQRCPACTSVMVPTTPLDEARVLVLHALHLDHDTPQYLLSSALTAAEKARVLALLERRIAERKPAAYLTQHGLVRRPRVLRGRARARAALADRGADRARLLAVARRRAPSRACSICAPAAAASRIACAYAFPDAHVDATDSSTGCARSRRGEQPPARAGAIASSSIAVRSLRGPCRTALRPDRQQSAVRHRTRSWPLAAPNIATSRASVSQQATMGSMSCVGSSRAHGAFSRRDGVLIVEVGRRERGRRGRVARAAFHLARVRARRRWRLPARARQTIGARGARTHRASA